MGIICTQSLLLSLCISNTSAQTCFVAFIKCTNKEKHCYYFTLTCSLIELFFVCTVAALLTEF